MLIQVGYEIAFQAPSPAATVLLGYLHPSRGPTVRMPERLQIEPRVAISEYYDTYGNHCARFLAPTGRVVLRNDAIVEDCGLPDLQVRNASAERAGLAE